MLSGAKKTILTYVVTFLLFFTSVFVAYVYVTPKSALGELFFGAYAPLYNVQLAHFFYEQSLRYDTEDDGRPPPYVHYQLSRIYFIEGDLRRALVEVNRELELYPEHVHANYIKGLTLGYLSRNKEAIEAFGLFIEYKPESWAPRNDRAWLQFRIGDIDGALETITPVVERFPDNPWILNTYGVLLMNKGEYEEARRALVDGYAASMRMTDADWGVAYPGNSPRIWETGLQAMQKTFEENIVLIDEKIAHVANVDSE